MANAPADQLVWIDCEMTGLDVEHDALVEIAVVITDFGLNELHEGLQLVINPGPAPLERMDDYVRNMHQTSGLLAEIAQGVELGDAERAVLDYVNEYVPKDRSPLLAGNTIGMDRAFLMRYMPTLDKRLHYRNLDVSSVKELARQWYPAAYWEAPAKNGGHRALADIRESIRELAYYQQTVFVADAGPDADAARAIAQMVVEEYDKPEA